MRPVRSSETEALQQEQAHLTEALLRDKLHEENLDGATAFVLTASYDKTAKLWSTVTGECTQTFSGHADAVSTEGARAWLLHGTLL